MQGSLMQRLWEFSTTKGTRLMESLSLSEENHPTRCALSDPLCYSAEQSYNSDMQYDINAIRVDNVRREQIGHIPRQLASTLARYMV